MVAAGPGLARGRGVPKLRRQIGLALPPRPDGLLGSARELTREAGLLLREGGAPRLAELVT
jgi:hypothetical protein